MARLILWLLCLMSGACLARPYDRDSQRRAIKGRARDSHRALDAEYYQLGNALLPRYRSESSWGPFVALETGKSSRKAQKRYSTRLQQTYPAAPPVNLENTASLQALIQSNAAVIEAGATSASTTGISSFDLFAGTMVSELGFFVQVQFGTPLRSFKMQIDTSSADTWVPSDHCAACALSHGSLGSLSSSSFVVATQNRWTAIDSYGANVLCGGVASALSTAPSTWYGRARTDLTNVSGVSVNDSFSLAGFTLPSMSFGVATQVQNEYSADWLPFAGVLGLGNSLAFPPLSLQHIVSPIVQLARAGLIPRAQVGIYLGRASQAGELALGGVDSNLFTGAMVNVPSVSRVGYWEAAARIDIAGRASIAFVNISTIFDTRSASILAPKYQLDALHLTTGSQGHVVLPCSAPGLVMSVTYGGRRFSIRPSDLVLLPVADVSCNSPPCCLSALQAAPAQLGLSSSQWIIGTAGLKSLYLGLDFESAQIGVAAVP